MQGIGLPMEEALAFWRAEFAQKTPPEKFNKEYAYGVRHNYGKEGGRKDYTPYSCLKIISTTPGVVRDVTTRATFDQTIRDLTRIYKNRHRNAARYGKGGGRKGYTPGSCLRIISSTLGVVRGDMKSKDGAKNQKKSTKRSTEAPEPGTATRGGRLQ